MELTSNPILLFDNNVTAYEMGFHGHKLGDSVHDLNLDLVEVTGQEIYPEKIDRLFRRGDKIYVEINREEIEFTLEERIQAVINSGGWLGQKAGARFRIKNQKIDSFALVDSALVPYIKFSKATLIEKLGKALTIKEAHDRDGYLNRREVIHSERQVLISWDDSRNMISDICLGKLVAEICDTHNL